MPAANLPLLRLENIRKSFGGTTVLDGASLEVLPGEVHALVGENGAGKSTLMNVVAGVVQPDAGRMFWEGRPVRPRGPRQAHALGIRFVHQELALVPQLSAGENVFLGAHPSFRAGPRWVRWREIHERAGALLEELGHSIDPRRPVAELSLGEQQLVEIARALALRARLIIMDEPTAPLSGHDAALLLAVVGRLRARGVSVIYITHRLPEVYQGPDRVTVLRDGRSVATAPVSEMPREDLVQHMVGRVVKEDAPRRSVPAPAAEALRVEGFTARGKFSDVSFHIRHGEIVGLAGLMGAGRSELLEALFRAAPRDAGRMLIDGKPADPRTPAEAIRRGLALVPDDRKAKGLIPGASLRWNLVLASQRRPLIQRKRETALTEKMMAGLRLRARDAEQPVAQLSGGNQQKVVLGRWLLAGACIFLLDEPTRGVDIGAKAEIREMIADLAARGAAVLLVSSELDEILRLADRILVMHRGRIAGELTRAEADERRIMHLATGGEAA